MSFVLFSFINFNKVKRKLVKKAGKKKRIRTKCAFISLSLSPFIVVFDKHQKKIHTTPQLSLPPSLTTPPKLSLPLSLISLY